MNFLIRDNHEIYVCPVCNKDLATGRILSINMICPYCLEPTKLDGRAAMKAIARPVRDTYGWDRLFLTQMHDNHATALKAGHSHYFTGRPCRNGHMAPRTIKGSCVECEKAYRTKNLNRIKKQARITHENFRRRRRAKKVVPVQVVILEAIISKLLQSQVTELETYGPDNLTIIEMFDRRSDALQAGHSHYYSGKQCHHGHLAPKETQLNHCVECNKKKEQSPDGLLETYGRAKLPVDKMLPTRKEAIAAGHDYYFTKFPCVHGHITPRDTASQICVKCRAINQSAYNDRQKAHGRKPNPNMVILRIYQLETIKDLKTIKNPV
jgi:hypothetical protein